MPKKNMSTKKTGGSTADGHWQGGDPNEEISFRTIAVLRCSKLDG